MKHDPILEADAPDAAMFAQMFGDTRPAPPADLSTRLVVLMLLVQGQRPEAVAAATGCDAAYVERLWNAALDAIETC